jgi:hypothetical protein
MKKIVLNIMLLLAVSVSFFSCEKDYGQFGSDNKPDVPVTYDGATTYGFNPYIEVPKNSTEEVTIRLQIPEGTGRSITEIVRVVGGKTAINAASVTTKADAANTIAQGIQGSGNSVVFTTTLDDLRAKFPNITELNGPSGTATYSEFAFMFLLKLDNNDTIIPVQFRLRITNS